MISSRKNCLYMLIMGLFLAGVPGETKPMVNTTQGTKIPTQVRKEFNRLAGQSVDYSPENTVVAFDFHDVLGDFDKVNLGKKIAKYATVAGAGALAGSVAGVGALAGFGCVAVPFVAVAAVLARKMLKKDKNGRKKSPEAVFACADSWDDKVLKLIEKEFVDCESLFTPNEGTFKIARDLKAAGYTVVLASNIGPQSLAILKKRYPKHFDGLFSYELIPSSSNEWTTKKNPANYFGQLADDVKAKFNKTNIIFIDDSKKNCNNAEKIGAQKEGQKIKGIQFTSAGKLREQLVAEHIL